MDILFRLIEQGVSSQVVNIGSGTLLSVNDIAKAVRNIVPTFEATYVDAQKFDASHFALDTTKLKSFIGDYQFTVFKEGITKTYNWLLSK